MCRGIGSFPWMPGYPAPHPATAHAAATASLFSSPALQQQLDIYYRQVAATQAAAAAQVLHQQKEVTSPNGSCIPNLLPSIQIPTPGPHLPQPNIHYKVLPSMLPIVSSPSTPLSLSPSKSGKGMSAQSSPVPQNPDGMSPSPPPISIPPFNPSQISQTHLAFSVKAKSNLDASKLGLPTVWWISDVVDFYKRCGESLCGECRTIIITKDDTWQLLDVTPCRQRPAALT